MNSTDLNHHKVEFYPSIDDLVYISLRVSETVPNKPLSLWAYWAFLFINGIAFPVFLLANEYPAAAIAVFTLNLAAVIFLIPRANTDHFKSFFNSVIPDHEKDLVTIELSVDGVRYSTQSFTSFIKWDRIKKIEETPESIFIFFEGNAWAVRKSGFAYKEQEMEFMRFGRSQLAFTQKELPAQ